MKLLVPALMSAALLGACTAIPSVEPQPVAALQPGAELMDRQVRLETAAGQTSMLHFAPDGKVHAQFGERQVTGNWVATNGQLCFSWAGTSRECWPYAQPLVPGQTVSLTSDRGNVVRVTLQ